MATNTNIHTTELQIDKEEKKFAFGHRKCDDDR